jgi:splicing factor 3B subunit 3
MDWIAVFHVSRRWATPTHPSACRLAPLHEGAEGPSVVLVGGEDWIEYLNEGSNVKNLSGIPRRKLHPPGKGMVITQIALHWHSRNWETSTRFRFG